MKILEKQLTKQTLLEYAGEVIYARGEDYFHAAAVDGLHMFNGRIIADVAGSGFNNYNVAISAGRKCFNYQCSCPMGEDGDLCKHVVAVGLVWLEHSGKPASRRVAALTDDTGMIRDYLLMQPKETLAEWLLEQCVRNTNLHAMLKQRADKALKAPLKKPQKLPAARRAKAAFRAKKTAKTTSKRAKVK